MPLQVGAAEPGVIRLVGEVDLDTGSVLEDALTARIERGGSLIVDLSGVSFMDSTGLRVILNAVKTMNGSGPLVLLHPTEPVRRLFDLALPGSVAGLEIRT